MSLCCWVVDVKFLTHRDSELNCTYIVNQRAPEKPKLSNLLGEAAYVLPSRKFSLSLLAAYLYGAQLLEKAQRANGKSFVLGSVLQMWTEVRIEVRWN